jgi:hypothetical protein
VIPVTASENRGTSVMSDLAALFEKRRADRVDPGNLVTENLTALVAAGITAAAIPDAGERRRVLRTVADGCGATAFALAATFSTDRASGTLYHAAVQLGLAERAYAVAIERLASAPSDAARQPGAQFAVARMLGALGTMTALLDRQAGRAAGTGADEDLAEACIAGMYLAGEAEFVVSAALGVLGGDAEGTRRLSLIWYDLTAVSAPVSGALARELVGKAAFGIDPHESPRWL